MENLWQDLRYGMRMLANSPGFTVVAVLTLALGIGANTAIFTVLDSVLLRSLPVSHPEQLAVLTDPDAHGTDFGSEGGDRSLLAYAEYEYLRDHNQLFSKMFAADSTLPELEVTISGLTHGAGGGPKETARVRLVSGDYFATLGIKPAAGRTFTPEDDRSPGSSPIAVVSYSFWRQRFGLSPAALGQTIQIHDTSFEIVGVTTPGFIGETVGEAPDIWVPLMMQQAIYPGYDYLSPSPQGLLNQYIWLQVMGRLNPGMTFAQAKASVNVAFKNFLESKAGTLSADDRREALNQRIDLEPGARGSSTLHSQLGQPLKLLMALVGLVLLIACANVANLLLARGAARQKEFAMRLAMGAGRGRLIRQLLTETLLLAMLGGVAGMVLAQWADDLLLRMLSAQAGSSRVQLTLQPDARILGFTLGLTLLTAMLFGLIPALSVTRANLSPNLKSTTVGWSGRGRLPRLPIGKLLVVAQVAVSLLLLVAAGLSVRSLSRLSQVQLGYNRENLLLFRVNPIPAGYKGPAVTQLYEQLLNKISAMPGVRGASVSHNGLFSHSESGDPVSVEGYTPKPGESMNSSFDHIGPGYFSAMGIPILIGREIGPQDTGNGPHDVVINQSFEKRFFGGANPIGKHIRDTYPGNPADMEVVGVVADAKYNSLREEHIPRVYAALFNPMWDQNSAMYEVRTYADPTAVSTAMREAVQETSRSLSPIKIHTMSGLVNESLQTDKFIERLSGAFGILALILASVGLYGIMAYTVARRTRDIGIRLALGAEPANVLRQVIRETLGLVLIGVAIGVPAAIGGTYLVRSMLYGMGVIDPVALGFAAVMLGAVAAIAGFLPARRASRVDPMVALRYE
jgi:predicted permease